MLVSCGDPNDPVVGVATPEPMQRSVDDRCEEVGEDVLELVAERLDVQADLEHPRLVRSDERAGLSFLAAELVGDDLDDEAPIGIWAVVGDGAVYAVNAIARYHSTWPDGTRLDPPLTMKTEGAEEVEACIEAATG